MEENLESILESLIEKIPGKTLMFLKEGQWLTVLNEIAIKNRFSSQEKAILETNVLFAIADPTIQSSLTKILIEDLQLSPILAHDIVEDIRNTIFNVIGASQDTKEDEHLLLDEGNEHLLTQPLPQERSEPIASAVETLPAQTITIEAPITPETEAKESSPFIKPSIHIPSKSAVEAKLSELKKLAQSPIAEKHYPGVDPYREPV